MEVNSISNIRQKITVEVTGSSSFAKNFRIVRNLLVSYILIIGFVLSMFFALRTGISLFLTSSPPEHEEILWEIVSNSLPAEDLNDDNNFYYELFADYIQEIMNSLPGNIVPSRYENLSIYITNDYSVNAFAAPGGRIILTKGLLNNIKSENGLMFVIGHEIGHLHRGDHLQEFARSLAATTVCLLSFMGDLNMIETILLADNHFTKDAEMKADIWGLKTIMSLYGHAGGSKEFFEILLSLGITGDEPEIFSTHPPTMHRMEKINHMIAKNNLPELIPISLE